MPRKVVSAKVRKVVDVKEEEIENGHLNGIPENNLQNDEKGEDLNLEKKKGQQSKRGGRKKADKKLVEENKDAENALDNEKVMNGKEEKEMEVETGNKSSERESSNKAEEKSEILDELNSGSKLTTKTATKRGRKKVGNKSSEGQQNQESKEILGANHSENSEKSVDNDRDIKENVNDNLVEEDSKITTAPNKRGRRKQENKVSQVKNEEKNSSKQLTRRGTKQQEVDENIDQEINADTSLAANNVTKSIPTKRARKRKNELKDNKKQLDNIDEAEEKSAEHEVSEKSPQNEKNVVKKELRVLLKRENNLEKVGVSDENGMKAPSKKAKQEAGNSKKTGNRRKRGKTDEDQDGESDDDSKPKKSAKVPKESAKSKSPAKKEKIPDVTNLDFSNKSVSSSGKAWNMKISSWNVNGIRSWLEKNGISYLHHEKPDIMCIQETKCSDDKLPEEVKEIEGYHCYWLAGDKDGYSGVGLLSKQKPNNVQYGIGIDEHDNEGRVITAEYEKFYVVATYVPNAGRGLVRLEYRMKWDKDFREYLKKLNDKKPVILCGDLNVAHEEIDLANPKTNKKNAGFTKEEREGFSVLLKDGFIDTFRHLYPDAESAYTFWTYMMNARAKNVGWRLDYFVISKDFTDCLCDSVIRKDVYGSDHCPIVLFIAV